MFGSASVPVALKAAPASSAATMVGRLAVSDGRWRVIAESRQAMRAQLAAVVLVPVLGALPFTDVYGRAGIVEHLLHLGATMLAVLALALLLTPVIARVAGQSSVGANRLVRAGVPCAYLASLSTSLLILDLGTT
jgi:hypothetical protein